MKGSHLAIIAVMGAVLVIGGCSAYRAYHRGQDLMAARSYDAAVREFTYALAKDPESAKYRLALDEARARSADLHVQHAQAALDSHDLMGASRHVGVALQHAPDHPQAKALAPIIDAGIAQAEALRAKAHAQADAGQLEQAVGTMIQALRTNTTLPEGETQLNTLRRRTADHLVALANQSLQTDDRNRARSLADRARQYVPGFAAAEAVLAVIRDRDRSDVLLAEARERIAAGDHDAALPRLAEARQLWPARPGIDGLILQTRQAICDRHLAAGRRLADANDHPAAIRAFMQSQAMLPNYGRVDDLLARSRGVLAADHRRRGTAAEQAGRLGQALVHYLLADEYVAGTSPAGAVERLSSQIRSRVQFSVQVATTRNQPLDAAVRDDLAARLAAASGPMVTVGGRGNFGLHVNVDVTGTDVDDTTAVRYGLSQYQDGVRLVPNPDFAAAVRDADYAQGRVEKYRSQVAELEQELRKLASHQPRWNMEGDQEEAEKQAERERRNRRDNEERQRRNEDERRKKDEDEQGHGRQTDESRQRDEGEKRRQRDENDQRQRREADERRPHDEDEQHRRRETDERRQHDEDEQRHRREDNERREHEEAEQRRQHEEEEEAHRREAEERQRRIDEHRRQFEIVQNSLNGKRSDLQDALRNMERARERVRCTPERIEEPIICDWQFPIQCVTRNAVVGLVLSADDLRTNGAILGRTRISGSAAASDETAAMDSFHNVRGDPLVLPHPNDLLARATDDAVGRAAAAVQQLVDSRGNAVFNAARAASATGQHDVAIELYADYLFMYPTGGDLRPAAYDGLAKSVDHAADLVSLGGALRARCGLMK